MTQYSICMLRNIALHLIPAPFIVSNVAPYTLTMALAFRVAKRVRLRIGVLSGFSSSPVVVRVDRRETLEWGRFLLWSEAGLDVAIF